MPISSDPNTATRFDYSQRNHASPMHGLGSSDTLSWCLVLTKPRQEHVALANLERQGYVCYVPKMNTEKIHRQKVKMVTESMFYRYLFIRLDTAKTGKSWSPIQSTLGGSPLVCFAIQPGKVDYNVIACLCDKEFSQPVARLFMNGDTVLVAEGIMSGIEAIYQACDAQQRSIILIEILSKPVFLCVESASLRKIEPQYMNMAARYAA